MNIKTDPDTVKEKPLPGRNAADTFAGAVGNFSIKTFVEKDTVLRNEENSLVIDINGAGNFQKISAPVVNWPQAIEAFDPSLTDTLDKQQSPLTGQRRFKYIFLSNKPGVYTIPATSFVFFDLKTRTYKKVSTKPHTIFVSFKNKKEKGFIVEPISTTSNNKLALWVSVVSPLLLITGIVLWFINKETNARREAEQKEKMNESSTQLISIEELLNPATMALDDDDKIFFKNLNQSIWNYFNQRFQLSGSQMNKTELTKILIAKGIKPVKVDELIKLIHQCENGIYADAEIDLNKKELFESTKQILKEIEVRFG
jgi:hypothetical protein